MARPPRLSKFVRRPLLPIQRPRFLRSSRRNAINAETPTLDSTASPASQTPETKPQTPATQAPPSETAATPAAAKTPADGPPRTDAPTDRPQRADSPPAATAPPKGDEKPAAGADEHPPRLWPVLLAAAILAAAALGVLISTGVIGGDRDESLVAPVPTATETVPGDEENLAVAAASELGFPTFATKNTTRVGGGDPAANAAAVALATFPASGEGRRPEAVTLVDGTSWATALAASVFVAEPTSAPLLFSAGDRLPSPTESALAALDPQGGPNSDGAQAIVVGDVAMPPGIESAEIAGTTPAELAVGIARLRARLTGQAPAAYVVVSEEDSSYAMPAAGWAARSGDPILFTGSEEVPRETLALIGRTPEVPVYVLGPESVVDESVITRIDRVSEVPVRRIEGETPVDNAIAFARYSDGRFGWNINDPGHGIVIAHAERPLDAAAAAPLSASGTWGPLLLTDRTAAPSPALRTYLLDIKPGYREDPTRALYNHIWIIGDLDTIGLGQQATLDALAELERIGEVVEPEPEPEPDPVPERDTEPDQQAEDAEPNDAGQATDEEEAQP